MGFERFGVVSFTSQTKASPFVEFLGKGSLAGTRCKKCVAFYFPPRTDCSRCLSGEMDWTELPRNGKLVSYTTLRYAPAGFEGDLPYTIALVEFENHVRAFGRLSKELEEEEISIGMDLGYRIVELSNDRLIYEFTTSK